MEKLPTKAMFIWLIIRLIRLVYSVGTVFFSQKNQPTVFFSRLINHHCLCYHQK
jgi:hypothetical protein